MQMSPIEKPRHGHHKIAAALFVGSLIVSSAMILSAELIKPERYEYHSSSNPSTYIIYDRNTGRATSSEFNAKHPTAALGD